MSKAKTDWEIARGLADWVMTLGLPSGGKHQKWAQGGEVEYYYEGDYVQTYVSGNFVVLEARSNGQSIHIINIHASSFGASFSMGEDCPTAEAVIEAATEYFENLDIRYWNKFYRNKLRFLLKDSIKREKEQKKAKIAELQQQLKELENV